MVQQRALLVTLLLKVFLVIILVACSPVFFQYIGIQLAFFSEIFAVIIALKMAKKKGWNHIWLECDSTLMFHAFNNSFVVLWQVRCRWENCLFFCKDIVFFCSYIFRANSCVDKLANFSISSRNTSFWSNFIPSFAKEKFLINRKNLPNYSTTRKNSFNIATLTSVFLKIDVNKNAMIYS